MEFQIFPKCVSGIFVFYIKSTQTNLTIHLHIVYYTRIYVVKYLRDVMRYTALFPITTILVLIFSIYNLRK